MQENVPFFGVEFYEFWQTCVLGNHHSQGIKHPQASSKFPGPRDASSSLQPPGLGNHRLVTASKTLSFSESRVSETLDCRAFWVWLLLLRECIRDAPTTCLCRWLVLCLCWTLLHCVRVPRLVYLFTVAGHVGCFQVWVIMNQATVNIHIQTSMWT